MSVSYSASVSVGVSLRMAVYLLTVFRCDQYRYTELLYETLRLGLVTGGALANPFTDD